MRKSLFFLVLSVILIPVILFSQQIGTGSCSLIIYATNELAQSGVVYINGKDVGTLKSGKLELFGFEVKKYSVVIDAPNIDKYEIEITFDFEYEVKELKFFAKPPTRTVRIETVPSGAKLYLDDKDIGTSPWEGKLDVAKSYKVRGELQGYRPLTQTISIPSKGDTLVFTLQLIENKPPEQPANPSPSDGQTNVSLQPTLSWQSKDPEGDKVEYDLYFGTTSSPELIEKGLKEAKFTVSKLESAKTYYWKVIARDELGKTTEGPIWKFTTINNPPSTPRNPQPGNNEKLVPTNVTLKWESTDPDGDKVTFDLYFGTNSNPPLVKSNIDVSNYTPGQLNYNTTYYWKVVAKDNKGATTEGPVWNFTTTHAPPTIPSKPEPSNGATNVPLTLTLKWESTSNLALKYDIYFGTDSNPPIYAKDVQTNRYTITNLKSGTTYYWKIIAKDERNISVEGPIWKFTTINNPPSIPKLIKPANESTGVKTEIELSWESTDPDGDYITYDLYFGTSENPSLFVGSLNRNYHLIRGLKYKTTYYWKIVAKDENGGFSESPVYKFTTESEPIDIVLIASLIVLIVLALLLFI